MPTCAELDQQLADADALIITRGNALSIAQDYEDAAELYLAAAQSLTGSAQSAYNAACTERDSIYQQKQEHDPPCPRRTSKGPTMDWLQTVSVIMGSGAVATVGGVVISGLKTRSEAKVASAKVQSEIELAKDAQEFNQQQVIIATQGARIEVLETSVKECVDERGKLNRSLGQLEGRIDQLNLNIEQLRGANVVQAQEAIKVAGEVAAAGVKTAAELVLWRRQQSTLLANCAAAAELAAKLYDEHVSRQSSK